MYKEFLMKSRRRILISPEFLQAVEEVLETLRPVLKKHPKYHDNKILERMIEPERVIMFRVPWVE